MDWIDSGGGPLVCAEESIASHWMGVYGLSFSRGHDARSDYERACSTRNHIDVIPCAVGSIIVLGDEPAQSCFFRCNDGLEAIARWTYAQPLGSEDFLLNFSGSKKCIFNPIFFTIEFGEIVMFDSASMGGAPWPAKMKIAPGRYQITSEWWLDEGNFDFTVHRFIQF